MGVHAVIPAVVHTTHHADSQSTPVNYEPFPSSGPSNVASQIYNNYPSRLPVQTQTIKPVRLNGNPDEYTTIQDLRTVSYGSTSDNSGNGGASLKGKDPDVTARDFEEDAESDDGLGLEPIIDVTWRYMSRLYLLVPIITLVWLALLMLLVTYAWPPNKREQEAGQLYPHPFLPKPFIIGIFASCTVQTIRVPIWVMVCWLGFSQSATTFLSTAFHSIIHELLRLSTLPLIVPSPTSGFHSSYYLGLGWGAAEVTWGVIQGWEQLALYREIMRPSRQPIALDPEAQEPDTEAQEQDAPTRRKGPRSPQNGEDDGKIESMLSSVTERSDEEREDEHEALDEEEEEEEEEDRLKDEADLERKVEILERIRARRELEEVIGVAYPNIPFPLHLLWRLDTLLLNLGLTLLLSAFYFNPTPIYRHSPYSRSNPFDMISHNGSANIPDVEPSRWLWLVWGLVVLVHVGVSLVWKIVGRLGIGAVTWGGLIVALGSVFAGLGSWGGLV
ncbi:hypothetical protein CI109_104114 [Kwoniella shandongensis]|uniref:Uncharacterized protein n=1 Tax=Kwoniella shandongensis TaxID=1734106 RepID=A0A5M6C1D3_9TREE|nr:uncharacterized protein CI109_002975 [Kwoniella shandongensis]KAA5528814.1 hypothetical protein CI109_002975 [Kwoniella shandongensis]